MTSKAVRLNYDTSEQELHEMKGGQALVLRITHQRTNLVSRPLCIGVYYDIAYVQYTRTWPSPSASHAAHIFLSPVSISSRFCGCDTRVSH